MLPLTLAAAAVHASVTSIERASVNTAGIQAGRDAGASGVSADGRCVVFQSIADGLVENDANSASDVFVRDLGTGVTERVSVSFDGQEGNGDSYNGMLSADGRYAVFQSNATNLVPEDTNHVDDLFVRDRVGGTTERVNLGPDGVQATAGSGGTLAPKPAISADGRFVVFRSSATNLVPDDTNGVFDVFVHDRLTGATERVSVGAGGTQGSGHSGLEGVAISADGRFVAFTSHAPNLVAGDTNGFEDVFVRDRETGTTERVSVSTKAKQGNDDSMQPALSADGRLVAFASKASTLVAGDTNRATDLFLRDRQTGRTDRLSLDRLGKQVNGESRTPALSADGRYVAFVSMATNLVPTARRGVFVRDRQTGRVQWVTYPRTGVSQKLDSLNPSLAADGSRVVFDSFMDALVPNDTNLAADVFVAGLDGASVNHAPTASAGKDRTLRTTGKVTSLRLDGSATIDPDGDLLTYTWTERGRTLGKTVQPQVRLTAGKHTLKLTVKDPAGATSTDEVVITIQARR